MNDDPDAQLTHTATKFLNWTMANEPTLRTLIKSMPRKNLEDFTLDCVLSLRDLCGPFVLREIEGS